MRRGLLYCRRPVDCPRQFLAACTREARHGFAASLAVQARRLHRTPADVSLDVRLRGNAHGNLDCHRSRRFSSVRFSSSRALDREKWPSSRSFRRPLPVNALLRQLPASSSTPCSAFAGILPRNGAGLSAGKTCRDAFATERRRYRFPAPAWSEARPNLSPP